MGQQIQLCQHNENYVIAVMFVAHLHSRLLKVFSLNLKLKAPFSISKKGHLGDLKNAALLEYIETVRSVMRDPTKSYRKRAISINIMPISLINSTGKGFKINPV